MDYDRIYQDQDVESYEDDGIQVHVFIFVLLVAAVMFVLATFTHSEHWGD